MGRVQPEVLGPVRGSRPAWGVPRVDPAAFGYTVQEYQLSGVAACYQIVTHHPAGEIEVDREELRYFSHHLPLAPGGSTVLREVLERQHYRLASWRVASGYGSRPRTGM